MKDLNRVLLVLLLDATIGPVSSGRNLDYRANFSRTERSMLGMTAKDAIQRHLVWFSEGLFAPTRVPTGGGCRAEVMPLTSGKVDLRANSIPRDLNSCNKCWIRMV